MEMNSRPLTTDERLVILELRKIKVDNYGEIHISLVSGGTEVIVKTTNIKKMKIQ